MESNSQPTDDRTPSGRDEAGDEHLHEHVGSTGVMSRRDDRLIEILIARRQQLISEQQLNSGFRDSADSVSLAVKLTRAAEIADLDECLRRLQHDHCETDNRSGIAEDQQNPRAAPLVEDWRAIAADLVDWGTCENGIRAVRRFGRFEIVRELGRGGLGVVLLARDPVLHRQVALKIPRPEALLTPDLRQRFQHEAQAAARLTHPHIVPVYEVGEIGPICFIASAFVEGQSLAAWIKDRSQRVMRVTPPSVVADLADAMQYAHSQGVLHRDLKPANVLLERREASPGESAGSLPVTKISDFGLAKILDLTSNETRTGAILGTPAYMAPEQAKGDHQRIGPATDVYGLGTILYELLTGRPPFRGNTDAAILVQVVSDEPAAPRRADPKLSRDLEAICLRALEKNPADRYASATDLAADLRRYLAGKPTQARPAGIARRIGKYGQRKPLVVALVSVLTIASLLVAGLAGAWVSDRILAADAIAAAQAAATVADGIERQHQYASNIQHAAEALRHGNRREVLDLLAQCKSLAREPVHCGIEWDYLWTNANRAERTFIGHPTGVSAVRFSPQGDLVASGGKDGRVNVWETERWTKRAELNYAPNVDVSVVEFSQDGSLLAAGGDDGRVVVYRVADFAVIYDEPAVDGRIFDLVWVGNSWQIAVGGDGTVLSIIDPIAHEHRRKTSARITRGPINWPWSSGGS